jgi:hypothetical protein
MKKFNWNTALPPQHTVEQLDAILEKIKAGTKEPLAKLMTRKELERLSDKRLSNYKRTINATLSSHNSCDCCGEPLIRLYPQDAEILKERLLPLEAQRALISAVQGERKKLIPKPKAEPELIR